MGRGITEKYYITMNENYVKGTLTCLKPGIIKTKISSELPLVLNIEPTNNCNAFCYYCPRREMVKQQGLNYLKLEDYKKIIDQFQDRPLIMLNLHKDGEPLLHKSLPEMVAYAREKKVAQVIHLNTNGLLLNTKVGKGIIAQGIDDITVSVDAATEKTYQKLKKLKDLAKLESDIQEIIEYRNKIDSNTRVRVKIMEFDEISKDEIDLFYCKWNGVADEVQVTGIHSWSGAIKDVVITDEQTNNRYPCALLWYMLAVNSNGKVSVCNVDWNYSGVVGDIHEQTINEIWNGDSIKKIRKMHLDGKYEHPQVCSDCVVWVSVGDIAEHLRTRKEFL